jgi:23S rRNA (guanosine2251-2'-O)-methyltransferase
MPDRDPPEKPPRRSPPSRWRPRSAKFSGAARAHGKREGRPGVRFVRGGRGEDEGPAILYGWHTVKAALENPARKFHRVLATENAARRLAEAGAALPHAPEIVRPDAIEALVGPEAVHQGLYAEADPLPSPQIEDLDPRGIVLVFDQITDPHNVGAILRSAAAFGVAAVVTTARHSPEATGVLAKAASGALEYVPIITVGNLARTLAALKERGFLTIGLDSAGDADLAGIELAAPLALVLGAEGKGLRQLTRTTCDRVARLDLPGRIKSLNVSNATALALYIATGRLAAAR